ncbi:hypothetical protein H5410_036901 [Solanum commersonii]|uniref:Uncharacterized protein n=1 Tax=Solanum commersonii TaxID=4109 RepID=A0A9J5Y678_SOLCO|nr:hypothetical protein H5410_036901 [Solanum commersonii]
MPTHHLMASPNGPSTVFVVVGSVFIRFEGSFGCCFVSGSSCWLQQCCLVMILAKNGESDGFGIGYLVGLVRSKLVRFMGYAPVWRKKENSWVGGVWSWELLVV